MCPCYFHNSSPNSPCKYLCGWDLEYWQRLTLKDRWRLIKVAKIFVLATGREGAEESKVRIASPQFTITIEPIAKQDSC